MSDVQQNPTPGWYPDPNGTASQRYWDGATWTDHTASQAQALPPTAPGLIQPAGKKSHKGVWIALVVIAAVVLGGIAACVAIVGGATVAVGGAINGALDDAERPASISGSVGDPVRDGRFEFVVTDFTCGLDSVGTGFSREKPQGTFCVASMSVTNTGREAQTFDASHQELFTANGSRYDGDTAASIAATGDLSSLYESINPGNQIEVKVVWDVPATADVSSLDLHDSILSGGVGVSV